MHAEPEASRPQRSFRPSWPWVLVGILILGAVVLGALALASHPAQVTPDALATNPALDPGQPLSGPAPDFTLTDQFDRPVSLHSFRGKVVLLAFNDSECTTVCPLTTTAMVDAKQMLGPAAASQVALLGIDANPAATAVKDVRAYSEAHGMVREWSFLTAALPQLKRVWDAYHIGVQIEAGQIDHTPALYVIDTRGRLARLYLTQLSYAAVPQLGQLVAQEVSRLLPAHPRVHSHLSYAEVSGISPTRPVSAPRAGGGTVAMGATGSPRLYLFFATWDQQVMNLRHDVEQIGAYQAETATAHLPPLTAVDEGSLEPAPDSLTTFLSTLPRRLPYPVAIDRYGRLADGYEVQDEPWLVLISGRGQILWYYDVSVGGWPANATIVHQVRAALARSPNAPSTATVAAELANSPPALARLHAQANRVIGDQVALSKRIRSLRGYPIVLNVWGSWCAPCVAEFGLFGTASAFYGSHVAFLGADVGDSVTDGQSFMQQHPVSYPSYQTSSSQLTSVIPQGLLGTPTTVFINRAGRLVYVHTGQYKSQGTLDSDIAAHALHG
jgi:cytochrome oxidase Cu insertion factor (SCO1/SenC/PrrC family)/thiol-disulfide isomerase/thioredoxin